jgi:hypothetical protein
MADGPVTESQAAVPGLPWSARPDGEPGASDCRRRRTRRSAAGRDVAEVPGRTAPMLMTLPAVSALTVLADLRDAALPTASWLGGSAPETTISRR